MAKLTPLILALALALAACSPGACPEGTVTGKVQEPVQELAQAGFHSSHHALVLRSHHDGSSCTCYVDSATFHSAAVGDTLAAE